MTILSLATRNGITVQANWKVRDADDELPEPTIQFSALLAH